MEIVIGVLALIVGAAIGAGITYYFTKPRLVRYLTPRIQAGD